jgi:MFS family permease
MRLLNDLPKNARTCIFVEPMWAVYGGVVAYYAPLFQKELGLSEIQMGIVNSVNFAFAFVFMLLGAPITNRMGRKRTSLVFDLFAWSLPMALWAISNSFAWFLAAAMFNAVVKIVIVSWNLLLSEDVAVADRSRVYGWIYLSGSAGGIFTLLGGILISRFGTVPTMRWIYATGSLCMTAMFVLRYVFTDETATGKLMMEKTRKVPLLTGIGELVRLGAASLRDRRFLRLLAVYFAANAVLSFDFYRVLYLTEAKGLSAVTVAMVPAIGAVVSLALFLLVMPRLPKSADSRILATSSLVCLVAQGAFVLMPGGSAAWALAVTGVLQAGYFLVQTHRDSVFMNAVSDLRKSDLFGLVQALTLLLSVPTGWLAGWLYTRNPAAPFVASCILYALAFLSSRRVASAHRAGSVDLI